MSRLRGYDDRGAVIVEFALVVSLIVTILFGLIEFGFAWETRLSTQNASRAGARVGSAMGLDVDADHAILSSVASALESIGLTNVERVVIYRSATSNGRPPAACTTGPTSDACNVFSGSDVATIVSTSAPSDTTPPPVCATSGRWCPSERQVVQASGTDYLGVYVRLKHEFVTGFFGNDMTLTDFSVMRLEPGR